MERPVLAAILSVEGLRLTDHEKHLFSKYNPLGVNIFARNIESKEQLKKLTSEIKEVIRRDDVIIAVDQEGGRVRRLAEPNWRAYASQIDLGKIGAEYGEETALKAINDHATLISNDLHEAGINLNYAPVLDIAFETTSPVIKSRCFGGDEKYITAYGKTMLDAYINNGICPCIKHMPGHGRVTLDPHLSLPILDFSLQELEKDFYPFQQLAYSPAGMTAHVVIPEIDDKMPITQSTKGIEKVIRGMIGFDGFLISDAIDMKALRGSLGEKAQTSLEAGCDAICYCLGNYNEMVEVCENCTNLADKSMIRFEKIKNLFQNNVLLSNLGEIADEYEALIGKIEKYDDKYDATEVLNRMKKNEGES